METMKYSDLAKQGRLPCCVIKVGSRYRVPTAELLALLGASLPAGGVSPER
ncbi:hypothetical protein [Actinomadura macrotermitis]|uniref:Uncharacterized protein n=1 Tax=Actinomadura macrotermitis TaxID=2585200 RepID=A0A7K0BYJ1_9ACTN|nr:hypothetical protein [Actinomadura macrotermitis]MQY06250.1 hypothetical protein [Actinomadura macrotermitis]